MKKFLIFLLLFSMGPFAAAAESSLFQGNYECRGKELGSDESFKLIMTIEKTAKTYSLKSRYEGVDYDGTGIYDSDNNNLSAVFINPNDIKETCIILFHAINNNALKARWTYIGEKRIADAFCKKVVP